MITITDARITADLREATVFYTVLGDPTAQAGTAAALESAKGLLRSTVGKALGLRHSPTPRVRARRRDRAREAHRRPARQARAAPTPRCSAWPPARSYAGDAQPYGSRTTTRTWTDERDADRRDGPTVSAGQDRR